MQVFVCSAESAKPRQHDSIATTADIDTTLGDQNAGGIPRWLWYGHCE